MRHSRTLTLKRKTLDADAPYASPLNAEQLNLFDGSRSSGHNMINTPGYYL
ncbi:hypothetical protein [Microcoleus sp. S13_C3]|uniref:hypothetical protein n=1 Tax=Microcoleus sp. S13_C3 TaxID=3055409 RepID=UPI002FD50B52